MKTLIKKINNLGQLATSDVLIFLTREQIGSFGKGAVANSPMRGLRGELSKLADISNFRGERGEYATVNPKTLNINRLILVGLGKEKELNRGNLERVGYGTAKFLRTNKIVEISCLFNISLDENNIIFPEKINGRDAVELFSDVIFGITAEEYSFDKYLTGERLKSQTQPIKNAIFISNSEKKLQKLFNEGELVKKNVFFCRDLVNEPANVIYPESFAKICKDFEKLGVQVEILRESDLEKLSMGALLAVGQGSARESCLAVLKWNGAPKDIKPIALVGKGVTFDSGGLSLKPANAMETMKCDMSGAAVTASVIRLLAMREAKVNVVGIIPLVENMPSDRSMREGDIIKSMSGQTIEILNTDAEGRLILADALYYAVEKFNPSMVIDLATLTGAICVALGERYAGLFTNSDSLGDELERAGKIVSENVWRMPLSSIGGFYDKQINSEIADVKNSGKSRDGGSIKAAQFLQRFTAKHPRWAHLDIAATAFVENEGFLTKKDATGFGVRLLNELIKNNYEK
ncbi:MAG: leucyl aminopeptidase [Rickettsiales bacterium]|jgi:leucyl aminopeptidase|nr:leucyl aminopeptidase [Rickettsiales bacterium]